MLQRTRAKCLNAIMLCYLSCLRQTFQIIHSKKLSMAYRSSKNPFLGCVTLGTSKERTTYSILPFSLILLIIEYCRDFIAKSYHNQQHLTKKMNPKRANPSELSCRTQAFYRQIFLINFSNSKVKMNHTTGQKSLKFFPLKYNQYKFIKVLFSNRMYKFETREKFIQHLLLGRAPKILLPRQKLGFLSCRSHFKAVFSFDLECIYPCS